MEDFPFREPVRKRTATDIIRDKFVALFVAGVLQPGDELPSERALATTSCSISSRARCTSSGLYRLISVVGASPMRCMSGATSVLITRVRAPCETRTKPSPARR